MCQSKAQGGKRCLAHAAASKFSVRVTTVKTGADSQMVEKALTELNREGKNLPAPHTEDVKNWIATRRFATQYDPELSDHERKIELNQLDRANEEVEAGVSGGHFHAWKNVMNSVKDKLRSRFVAAALVPIMAVGVAGCGPQIGSADPNQQPSSPSISQGPAGEELPSGSNGIYQEGQYYLYGNEVKVSDADGEYEQVYRPALENFTNSGWAEQPVGQQLIAAGFSAEDIDKGQQLANNIALDVSFDSSVSDRTVSDSEYANWLQDTTSKYKFDAEMVNGISNKHNDIVFTGYVDSSQGQLPKLVHDGFPRIAEGTGRNLAVYTVRPLDVNGQTQMVVTLNTDLLYRVSDQDAINYTAGLTGKTPEEVLSTIAKPSLKDNQGVNYLRVSGTYDVAFKKEGSELVVTGIQSTYKFDASNYING